VVLAACESVTSKQSWRYPTTADAAYLTQLAAWGYTLSLVEQIVTGTTDKDATAGADGTDSAPTNEDDARR
jgi:ParB family chromosome partitioning protein